MDNFVFSNPTKIVFGRGVELQAGSWVKPFADRVLLHFGGGSAVRSGLVARIRESLAASGVDCVEFGGVEPNPRVSLVREGIALCRKEKLSFILAVGGGSVIDSAKAIAVGVPHSGDVWDFFDYSTQPETALPVGAVLTIPAAGSESSSRSVISNTELELKRSVTTDLIRPRFALMNPELTFTLPPFQSACGIADIMSHIMERYFTNTRDVELTDRLCEAALRTVIVSAPAVMRDPSDYAARAEIMWTGSIAHNDLLNTGREGDWASHAIGHELSAFYDAAHGAGLAVIFPAWMKFVYRHDIARFAQFANRVWEVESDHFNPEKTALEGIRRTEAFFRSLCLPSTLTGMGLPVDRFAEIAAKCTVRGKGFTGKFVKLDPQAVIEILTLAK